MKYMGLTYNTEIFVQKSKNLHKNKYDYTLTSFISSQQKVKICCPEHGVFEQTPNKHLMGQGCKKCGWNIRAKKKTLNQKIFITRSESKHGRGRYDYSKTHYENKKNKIEIICNEHETPYSFFQTPEHHWLGNGCPKCGGNQKLTNEIFKEKANTVHQSKYNYSKVNYINNEIKIEIICNKHGSFWQTPNKHLDGNGCPKCAIDLTRITLEDVIYRAQKIHENKYDYSKSVYINARTKIIIICPIHKEFKLLPSDHIRLNNTKGCPCCNKGQISKPETKWLDSLNLPRDNEHRQVTIHLKNEKYIKVDGYDPITNTVYEFWGDFWHGNPKKYNPTDIHPLNYKSYGQLYKQTLEKIQNIKNSGYTLVQIWENDYNTDHEILYCEK